MVFLFSMTIRLTLQPDINYQFAVTLYTGPFDGEAPLSHQIEP